MCWIYQKNYCMASLWQSFCAQSFASPSQDPLPEPKLNEASRRSSAAKEPKACMCIPFAFAKAVFDFVDDAFNS